MCGCPAHRDLVDCTGCSCDHGGDRIAHWKQRALSTEAERDAARERADHYKRAYREGQFDLMAENDRFRAAWWSARIGRARERRRRIALDIEYRQARDSFLAAVMVGQQELVTLRARAESAETYLATANTEVQRLREELAYFEGDEYESPRSIADLQLPEPTDADHEAAHDRFAEAFKDAATWTEDGALTPVGNPDFPQVNEETP